MNQRAGGFAFLNQKCVASKTWGAGFICGMGSMRFGIDMPVIPPAEIVATVRDTSSGPENCHLFTRAMNDRNPKLPGRAFFYQNRCVRLAVAIKISFQIGRAQAKGELILFSRRSVR